jgi:hypothetical protein
VFFHVREQIKKFVLYGVINAINDGRNILSVIQAKIWPKKHVILPKCGNVTNSFRTVSYGPCACCNKRRPGDRVGQIGE